MVAVRVEDVGFLLRNKRVKRLLKNVREGTYSIDTESLMDEIEQLHSTRRVRSLSFNKLAHLGVQKPLIQAELQNQAYRSRITEIKMMALRRKMKLDRAIELIRKRLKSKYSSELRTRYRTAEDRNDVIASILEPATRLADELEAIEYYADEVIKDIDQAAWTLKAVTDALNLTITRERS